MPFYASPGIYVEEVPSGARPIGAVGTSTAGFVGTAPDAAARLNEAVAVNSWSEFLRIFASNQDAASTPLARGVFGFFDNGGGRCFVVNIPEGDAIGGSGRGRTGLAALEAIDEVAIVAAPGYADALSYEELLSHCERLGDRVAILDPPAEITETEPLTRVATVSTKPKASTAASADAPKDAPAKAPAKSGESPALRPRQSDYGTFYAPWIVVRDPLSGETVATPPSGHIAGVWARTDTTRGVHKAPANEPIRGVVDLTYRITRGEQETLNPAGVNCIRYFPAEGVRIWGARTLAAEASEWRYLNVRRLFSMLKESIGDGTRWIVFEPNDQLLWRSIRRDIGAFLTRVWRDGALMGRTPQEAFFVKCDEETNPVDVRDAGMVIAEIGVAPVKPAEFVVFKLSQSSIGSETESLGG
ncbi:MAG TPA: phage tail sheath subtilisin-like domain-containing protein [Micromonosporaceae bacterium]|nr:phage tail sheath subtilisin-like domain-containing protein [Micromonosporaceae bacterium]